MNFWTIFFFQGRSTLEFRLISTTTSSRLTSWLTRASTTSRWSQDADRRPVYAVWCFNQNIKQKKSSLCSASVEVHVSAPRWTSADLPLGRHQEPEPAAPAVSLRLPDLRPQRPPPRQREDGGDGGGGQWRSVEHRRKDFSFNRLYIQSLSHISIEKHQEFVSRSQVQTEVISRSTAHWSAKLTLLRCTEEEVGCGDDSLPVAASS